MTGKRDVLRRCLEMASDGADVTCDGRLFQKVAPETGEARLPTVEIEQCMVLQVDWWKSTVISAEVARQ